MTDERTVVFQLPTTVSGTLACIAGTAAGRSWELSAGTFVIGRAQGSHLHLPNEPGVSKLHAKIVAEGDHYSLQDSESRNGTIVNGRPVKYAKLKDGDEIQICGCKLRFSQIGGAAAEASFDTRDDAIDHGAIEPTLPAMGGGPGGSQPPVGTQPPQLPPDADDVPMAGPPTAPYNPGPSTPPPTPGPEFGGAPGTEPGFAPVPGSAPGVAPPGPGAAPHTPPPSGFDPGFPPVGMPQSPADMMTEPRLELIEVRKSTVPWFVSGLLLVLLGGGGAYATLVFLEDPLLLPPGSVPSEPVDDGTDPDAEPDPGATAPGEPEAEPGTDEPPANNPDGPDVTGPDGAEPEAEASAGEPEGTAPDVGTPEDGAAAAAAAATWYPTKLEYPPKTPIRIKSGGRVRAVEAERGARVSKGDVLLRFDAAGNAAEIATLKESIRALRDVVEASGSERAAAALGEEEAKLKKLQAGARSVKVTAPASGTLVSFSAQSGDRLRSRMVVGFVRSPGDTKLVAQVAATAAGDVDRGDTLTLRTKSGEEVSGQVTRTPRKRGNDVVLYIEPKGASLDAIKEVRLP